MNNKYTFDISTKFEFWNQDHWDNFEIIKKRYSGLDNLNFLEIGVCEGWTTTKLLDSILIGENSHIHCIDPDPTDLFTNNLLDHKDRYTLYKDYSYKVLPRLLSSCLKFDFVYVDGDHLALSVLEDMVMSWRLLKVGGLLLVDDYEMKIKDPWMYKSHKEFKDTPRLLFIHPMVAISAFMTIYRGCYTTYIDNYQIGLIKTVDLCEKNIKSGDNLITY
jgi:hypothetical protein